MICAPRKVNGRIHMEMQELAIVNTGVDYLLPRDVLDFQKKSYCNMFIHFLLHLNGRMSLENDFTYVSSNGGASVIDNCLVPYEDLVSFEIFSVHRIMPLIQDVIGCENIDNILMPDLSILSCSYLFSNSNG